MPRRKRRRVVVIGWGDMMLACGHWVPSDLHTKLWRRGLPRRWPKHARRTCRQCAEASRGA